MFKNAIVSISVFRWFVCKMTHNELYGQLAIDYLYSSTSRLSLCSPRAWASAVDSGRIAAAAERSFVEYLRPRPVQVWIPANAAQRTAERNDRRTLNCGWRAWPHSTISWHQSNRRWTSWTSWPCEKCSSDLCLSVSENLFSNFQPVEENVILIVAMTVLEVLFLIFFS